MNTPIFAATTDDKFQVYDSKDLSIYHNMVNINESKEQKKGC